MRKRDRSLAHTVHRAAGMKNPSWWNEKHDSAWERTKSAMKRDWEQTRSDFGSDRARDLDQGAGDTVKQAMGRQPIPPGTQPSRWEEVEPVYRYGVGARTQYGNTEWNPDLESRLQRDWSQTGADRPWDQVKGAVKRAWQRIKD